VPRLVSLTTRARLIRLAYLAGLAAPQAVDAGMDPTGGGVYPNYPSRPSQTPSPCARYQSNLFTRPLPSLPSTSAPALPPPSGVDTFQRARRNIPAPPTNGPLLAPDHSPMVWSSPAEEAAFVAQLQPTLQAVNMAIQNSPDWQASVQNAANAPHSPLHILKLALDYGSVGTNMVGAGLVVVPYVQKGVKWIRGREIAQPAAVKTLRKELAKLGEKVGSKWGGKWITTVAHAPVAKWGSIVWAIGMGPQAVSRIVAGYNNGRHGDGTKGHPGEMVTNLIKLFISTPLMMVNKVVLSGLTEVFGGGFMAFTAANMQAKDRGQPAFTYDFSPSHAKLKEALGFHLLPDTHLPEGPPRGAIGALGHELAGRGARLGWVAKDFGRAVVEDLKYAKQRVVTTSQQKFGPPGPFDLKPALNKLKAGQVGQALADANQELNRQGWFRMLFNWTDGRLDPARADAASVIMMTTAVASGTGTKGIPIVALRGLAGVYRDFGPARTGASEDLKNGDYWKGGSAIGYALLSNSGSMANAAMSKGNPWQNMGQIVKKVGEGLQQLFYMLEQSDRPEKARPPATGSATPEGATLTPQPSPPGASAGNPDDHSPPAANFAAPGAPRTMPHAPDPVRNPFQVPLNPPPSASP
jgi:hypothetical protein